MAGSSGIGDKYEVLEKIGHGSFGVIRKVRREKDGLILCRKEISYVKMSVKEREQLHSEFSILQSLRHPNIVGYFTREHMKLSQDLHIYMEYCGGGDLGKIIRTLQHKNQFAEEEFVWSIFSQLVTALYRCHYGINPPEVGKSIQVTGNSSKPTGLRKKNQPIILHRDLKPENVFLGEDNSVKLGDFGLSKILTSHDFASTYVGTPYYMSPEICAAERYTTRSDVWSLGCVMYELCARRPPFDAKTHFHLVQRIKEGKVDPLPEIYSEELQHAITSCLRTNSDHRPETADLLDLPYIRLMRKEKEVVDLGKTLKLKEGDAVRKIKEAEVKLQSLSHDEANLRSQIDSTLRREWEVKAQLEINRRLQLEKEAWLKKLEKEFETKVAMEVESRLQSMTSKEDQTPSSPTSDYPLTSFSTFNDAEAPSSTDMSSLSMESPLSPGSNPMLLKKGNRTPFSRVRTQFDSPMDVQMVDPSPMSIASLSLSPRRSMTAAPILLHGRNIFAAAAAQNHNKWQTQLPSPTYSDQTEDDDADDILDVSSPTRPPRGVGQDPFKKPTRPSLGRQVTAPVQKSKAKPPPFPVRNGASSASQLGQMIQQTNRPLQQIPGTKQTSPVRRLSGLPNILDAGSPVRRGTKGSLKGLKPNNGGEEMFKAVVQRNMLGGGHPASAPAAGTTGGRTLIQLAHARTNGNLSLSATNNNDDKGSSSGQENEAPARSGSSSEMENQPALPRAIGWEPEGKYDLRVAPVWDPDRDEMPSPFIARGRRGVSMDLRR